MGVAWPRFAREASPGPLHRMGEREIEQLVIHQQFDTAMTFSSWRSMRPGCDVRLLHIFPGTIPCEKCVPAPKNFPESPLALTRKPAPAPTHIPAGFVPRIPQSVSRLGRECSGPHPP